MSETPSTLFGEASRRMPPPQPPEPGLNIVSTPIGNLRDMTLRAIDALAGADCIYAEDTRNARKLMEAFGLSGKVLPYHDHNGAKVRPQILQRLQEGQTLALISDAGTPLISDPGYKLVKEAVDAGHPVRAIPGASAVLTGLAAAGLPSDQFLFSGFLPPKSGARKNRLRALASIPATLVFYESGPRLLACLKDALEVFGDREAVVARELTKKFEEFRRGALSELVASYDGAANPKGEITLLIGPPASSDQVLPDEAIEVELAELIAELGVKGAAAHLAERTGLPRRDLYARAQRIKDETS